MDAVRVVRARQSLVGRARREARGARGRELVRRISCEASLSMEGGRACDGILATQERVEDAHVEASRGHLGGRRRRGRLGDSAGAEDVPLLVRREAARRPADLRLDRRTLRRRTLDGSRTVRSCRRRRSHDPRDRAEQHDRSLDGSLRRRCLRLSLTRTSHQPSAASPYLSVWTASAATTRSSACQRHASGPVGLFALPPWSASLLPHRELRRLAT